MERRSVASRPPRAPKSFFDSEPSAIDPSRNTFVAFMSFTSEWFFKPEGVQLVKKRFQVELARLEHMQPWDFQISICWFPEDALWKVKCAKIDYSRVWKTLFAVINGVIREAIQSADQIQEVDDRYTVDEADADEDYDFSRDEPLESNLIQRLAVWKMQNDLYTVANPELDDRLDQADSQVGPVAQDELYPAEIEYYEFRQAWNCGDKNIMLDELLPEADLQELARLTSCQFSKNLNNGVVFVGAHDNENLLLAIHKLDNIERNWPYRHPWVNHMFYNEETSNARYVLKYYVDIRMFYFETTLLDNLQVTFSNGACDYETLIHAVTVRCAPHVPVKSEYVPIKKLNISAIKVEELPGGVNVFSTAFTYNGKGVASENPLLHRPAHAPEPQPAPAAQSKVQQEQKALAPHLRNGPNTSMKDESVQKWATSVPDAISSGISSAPTELTNALLNLPNDSVIAANDHGLSFQKPDWDKYEEYRPEKAAKIVESEHYWKQRRDGPFGLINRPLISNHQPTAGPHLQIQTTNGRTRQSNSAMSRSASMPQVTTSSDGLMEPLKPIILHQQPIQPGGQSRPQQLQPAVIQKLPRGHVRSTTQNPSVPLPTRSPSRRLFSQSIARSGTIPSSLLDEDDPIAESLQVGILEPALRVMNLQNQAEKEQLVREPDTRIFHHTMNQRKPRPNINPLAGRLERQFSPPKSTATSQSKNGLVVPRPEFVEEINQSFKELMAGLRGYRGKAVVQVEFGRIILGRFHPKQLSAKGKDQLLDGAILQSMLLNPTDYGPTADFTSVLTTVPAEIQYMVNMKDKGGQNLWEMNKVSNWNTTYEFVFTDPQNPLYPVMIEVDAENFTTQIKTRCRLGNIFIHGTKRHWDVKIAAIGYGNRRALGDKYGDLAKAIQSSLYIPSGSHRPYLCWKLDASLKKQFAVQDVAVRRVYEYNSIDQKSILKVSELQSLDIDGGPAGKEAFWIFEAMPGNPGETAIKKLTAWYEASITSVQLDAVLKQNESLHLGDETAWTLQDVANMEASKSLYSPALEMLPQLDGVGQRSHNDSNYRSRLPAEHVMQAQAAQDQVFWW